MASTIGTHIENSTPAISKSKLVFVGMFLATLAIAASSSFFVSKMLIKKESSLINLTVSSYINQFILQDNLLNLATLNQSVFASFYDQLRSYFHVEQVKILLPNGKIIWSNNTDQIGQIERSNAAFIAALKGNITSHSTHLEKKQYYSRDSNLIGRVFVSWLSLTYIPIVNSKKQVIGIAEIYRVPQFLFEKLTYGLLLLWSILGLTCIVLFLFSYGFQAKTSNKLIACKRDLIKAKKLAVMGEFVSMIVHDTRNLLLSIRFICNKIKSSKLNQQQRDSMIQQSKIPLELSFALMEDLLGFVSGKTINLDCDKHNVHAIIQDGHAILSAILEPSGHKLVIDKPDDITIYCDRRKFLHMLVNLVRNSAEAMMTPGIVTIKATRVTNGTHISVRDTGKGIPKELLPHIFDPFVSEPGKSRPGLGLAIIRNLVKQHGGDVTVCNLQKGGAEVTVTLPDCQYRDVPKPLAPEKTISPTETS